METIGVTAASRGQLSRIVRAAHRDGQATLITVDGEPAAYVVPAAGLHQLLAELEAKDREADHS